MIVEEKNTDQDLLEELNNEMQKVWNIFVLNRKQNLNYLNVII